MIKLLLLCTILYQKRVYLCNVQHCIYKEHLNTGFSSNTETTINRFDITVSFFFFFFSSAVFKWTQKCIINNIHFRQINPTQLVHTQAKLFKCTMIDSRSKRVPAPLNSTAGTKHTNQPHACLYVCVSVCVCALDKASSSLTTNTHTQSHSLQLSR